jgi:hypothetical protein
MLPLPYILVAHPTSLFMDDIVRTLLNGRSSEYLSLLQRNRICFCYGVDKSEVFQFAFGIVKEMVLILGRAGFLELVAEDTLQKPIPLAKVVTIVRILAIEFASDIGNIAITRNSGLSTTEKVMWSRMMRPTSG